MLVVSSLTAVEVCRIKICVQITKWGHTDTHKNSPLVPYNISIRFQVAQAEHMNINREFGQEVEVASYLFCVRFCTLTYSAFHFSLWLPKGSPLFFVGLIQREP